MRAVKPQRTCPCGQIATMYKYCSVKCRGFYSRLNTRKKPGYHEQFRKYHKQWRDKNKHRVKVYASKITKEQKRASYLRNRQKHLDRGKAYYKKNAERLKAHGREYHRKNKTKIAKKTAAYRAKHRAELSEKERRRYHLCGGKEKLRKWREENREHTQAYQKLYNQIHAEEIAEKQKRRLATMDRKKRRERERKYKCKQRRKKMETEFSLLSGILANKAQKT